MFFRHGMIELRLKPHYRASAPIIESRINCPRIGLSTSRYFASDRKQASPNEDSLIDVEPPSSNHHDLKSFLSYTQRSGLDEKSTVYVGTHYEYTVAAKLARYGFSLRRVGGSFDAGTDLVGTWKPPAVASPPTLKVLIQCKASAARSKPQLIRELEGAFVGAPPGWRGEDTMALLVTDKPATKGTRDALGRSRWPMGYVCCSREGAVLQMIWNRRAEETGLEGFGAAARYVGAAGEEAELVLTRHGEPLPLLDEVE